MIPIAILLTQLVVLSLYSNWMTQACFQFVYAIFHSRPVAISLTTLLFFPGTVVHELSHLFIAEIMGVRTGKLNLVPENIEGEDIHVGSVEVAQSDPFRRAIIGLAPLFVGLAALFTLSYFYANPNGLIDPRYELLTRAGLLYLLFCVSTTMFPSKPDLTGTWQLMVILGVVFLALLVVGLATVVPVQFFDSMIPSISLINEVLFSVLLINTGILLFFRLALLIGRRV